MGGHGEVRCGRCGRSKDGRKCGDLEPLPFLTDLRGPGLRVERLCAFHASFLDRSLLLGETMAAIDEDEAIVLEVMLR